MVNKTKYKNFEELPVLQCAHRLTLNIYRLSKIFPKDETYALTSQIRRASSSIGANIAEGFDKNTTKDLLKFLYIARGSCSETIYHLLLARDLSYISLSEYNEVRSGCDEVGKQLNGWISSLKKKLYTEIDH